MGLNTDYPFISVVMPVYNSVRFVEKAIRSFIDQPYEKKELVIVDGKSTDGSHDIIRKFDAEFDCIRWIRELDSGLSNGFNIGVGYAKGEFVGFLAGDDYLCQDVLSKIAYQLYYSGVDMVFGDAYNYYYFKKKFAYWTCPNSELSVKNLVECGAMFGGEDYYIRKSWYEKYPWNNSNNINPDYEFMLEVANAGIAHMYLNTPISVHLLHDKNISLNQEKAAKDLTVELIKRFNTEGYTSFLDDREQNNIRESLLKRMLKWIYRRI